MQKKKEVMFYIATVFSCLLAMTVVVIAALLIYDKLRGKEEDAIDAAADVEIVTYSQEEVDLMLADAVAEAEERSGKQASEDILSQIQSSLEDGATMVETLRPLYPNHIVLGSGGRLHFIPIRDDLRQHSLVQENLQVLENGELQYVENGEVISKKGIDVSSHQGDIDWQKVAASGVEFAIIRAAFRGYGQAGNIVVDSTFEQNIQGAIEAGIEVGVYFYAQAITEEEAHEEADVMLEVIQGYDITYPVIYDVEMTDYKDGRMNQISVEERTRITRIFVDRIKEAGYTPMVYSNMEMWSILLDMSQFEDIDKWYANYGTELYFPYEFAIWQYSDKGRVDGINGNVDMNISFKDW